MKKLAFTVAALTALGAFPAAAADLLIDQPVLIAESGDTAGWYFEALGGAALAGTAGHYRNSTLNHSHDLLVGPAAAGVIGYEIMENVSVELDAMISSRELSGTGDHHSTASLMAGVRYTLDIADGFSLHAGAALGAIGFWDDSFSPAGGGTGLGYQFKAGATVDVTEQLSVVGELRYQAPFGRLDVSGNPNWSVAFGTTTAMAGIKIRF